MASKWLATLTELAGGGENVSAELTQSACIILLMDEGMTVEELAAQFDMSKTRIITLRQRFMILGPLGLQRPAHGVYGHYLTARRPDESFVIRPFPRPKKQPLTPLAKTEGAIASMRPLVPPLGPTAGGQLLHPWAGPGA